MNASAGVAVLAGKTVLVTGGAKRIGRAICEDLSGAGCHVIVHHGFSKDAAQELVDTIQDHGRQAWRIHADLSDPGAAEGLVAEAAALAGRPIDLLVNNASAFPKQPWNTATYPDMDAMMRIHAWAPFALGRALAAQGGRAVVNLLDTRIVADDPMHAPYLLSKQALWHLTQDMARTFAPMRVNGVAPGPILPPTGGTMDDFEAARQATVLGSVGSAQGVAHAVRFLLENEYVTGDTVFVDGGRHLQD